MNEREHMLDDSPLSKEKVKELKTSAEEMLREFEAANDNKDLIKPAIAPA